MSGQQITEEVASKMLELARRATTHAYVPYSEFPVGACILADTGEMFTGVNIENASYPLTVCAERVAVNTAAATGIRSIVAVAVTAPRADQASPCGACRQVLNEFKPVDGDMVVILDGKHGVITTSLGKLLPMAFGPRDLAEVK